MAKSEKVWRMTEFRLPEPIETANLIRRALADFTRRMRSLRPNQEISASKLSLLGRLIRADRPLTATELAALERLQPQSLTRIIAELETDRLIERRPRENDRRQLDIAITRTGVEVIQAHAHARNVWLADAMEKKLTPAERAILVLAAELLDRMADHDGPELPVEPTPMDRHVSSGTR
jgi:DNA-binding MarR family transcriptional regulator